MILSILKVAAFLIQGTFDLAVVCIMIARERKDDEENNHNNHA